MEVGAKKPVPMRWTGMTTLLTTVCLYKPDIHFLRQIIFNKGVRSYPTAVHKPRAICRVLCVWGCSLPLHASNLYTEFLPQPLLVQKRNITSAPQCILPKTARGPLGQALQIASCLLILVNV